MAASRDRMTPRPSRGETPEEPPADIATIEFQSAPPAIQGGNASRTIHRVDSPEVSIRPPGHPGGKHQRMAESDHARLFQSAPPAIQGETVLLLTLVTIVSVFQSPPPAIQGGNETQTLNGTTAVSVSIRPPAIRGKPPAPCLMPAARRLFQSAPPAIQGGNPKSKQSYMRPAGFNPPPRPSRGETTCRRLKSRPMPVSIRPPGHPETRSARRRCRYAVVSIRPPGHPGGKPRRPSTAPS